MTPMPTARAGLGVAVVDGKIYAIGGFNGSTVEKESILAINELYNPATDSWTTKTSMPTPRYAFGIAVYQNKIYCIGGKNEEGVTGVNQVYDPETDTWENVTALPTPRAELDANVVGDKIYMIGGGATQNEVYDPSTDTWSTETPLPTAVYYYASAVVDNKIYLIGASDLTLNQIYDTEKDSWSTGAPVHYLSTRGTGVATTGEYAPKRIYVIGGGSAIPISDNLIYDPESDVWNNCTRMPTARDRLAVAVVDDILYAIGGANGWMSGFHATNEQYTPVGYGYLFPPELRIYSPQNITYFAETVSLNFTVNDVTSWMGYSLDGQNNVTITEEPLNLTGLANGLHSLTVYAKDIDGNMGASGTVYFTVKVPLPPWIAVALVLVIVAVTGILVLTCFRDDEKKPKKKEDILGA